MPVSNFTETALILRLVGEHLSKISGGKKNSRKAGWSLDYDSLAASFNDEVSDLYQSDPRALLESGLRLKSPAHIKVFL